MARATQSNLAGILTISLSLFLVAAGCQNGSTHSTRSGDQLRPTSSLALVSENYNAGRYHIAMTDAEYIFRTSKSQVEVRDQAAYFVGLSAFQTEAFAKAEQYLKPLEANRNDTISGNSSATLGLIDLRADRAPMAVVHFKRASRKLEGEDRAQAAFQCGLAYRQLGQTSSARQQFMIARATTNNADFRNRINTYVANTGWTIQLGAFTRRSNAELRAAQFDSMTTARASLGPALILDESDATGHTLYVVQVGNFMDYTLATRARDQITGPAMILTIDPDAQSRLTGAQIGG